MSTSAVGRLTLSLGIGSLFLIRIISLLTRKLIVTEHGVVLGGRVRTELYDVVSHFVVKALLPDLSTMGDGCVDPWIWYRFRSASNWIYP